MFDFISKYKIFSQAVLVLIVLTFALFGVDSYFRGQDSAQVVAEVGSSAISQQELSMMVRQEQDRPILLLTDHHTQFLLRDSTATYLSNHLR